MDRARNPLCGHERAVAQLGDNTCTNRISIKALDQEQKSSQSRDYIDNPSNGSFAASVVSNSQLDGIVPRALIDVIRGNQACTVRAAITKVPRVGRERNIGCVESTGSIEMDSGPRQNDGIDRRCPVIEESDYSRVAKDRGETIIFDQRTLSILTTTGISQPCESDIEDARPVSHNGELLSEEWIRLASIHDAARSSKLCEVDLADTTRAITLSTPQRYTIDALRYYTTAGAEEISPSTDVSTFEDTGRTEVGLVVGVVQFDIDPVYRLTSSKVEPDADSDVVLRSWRVDWALGRNGRYVDFGEALRMDRCSGGHQGKDCYGDENHDSPMLH